MTDHTQASELLVRELREVAAITPDVRIQRVMRQAAAELARRSIPQGDDPAKAAAQGDESHAHNCGNKGCTGCVDPDDLARELGLQGDEMPPLPEMPRSPVTHSQLGPLFDRISMHQYAVRYVDLYREYGASCRAGEKADARDAATVPCFVCQGNGTRAAHAGGWYYQCGQCNGTGAMPAIGANAAIDAALSAQKGGEDA